MIKVHSLRLVSIIVAVISALTASLWVAICAAAPEFIWRGLKLFVGHLDGTTLVSALLVGLILAFFVEPIMERLHGLRPRAGHAAAHGEQSMDVLFTAFQGLAFALAAVCLHDAISTYLSSHGSHGSHGSQDGPGASGLVAGLRLTTAWAIVPFATMLAWQSRKIRWLALPTGLLAIASSYIAGKVFAWSMQEIIDTTIISVIILGVGYREFWRNGADTSFARCGYKVALLTAAWFAIAFVLDLILESFGLSHLELYDPTAFGQDIRFYGGWSIGLLLVPAA